jgi:predicted ATPase/tetratricopeptide (TPR) repeat protein
MNRMVTFLFADVEDSVARVRSDPQKVAAALRRRDDVLRIAVADAGGTVMKPLADTFRAAFRDAGDALAASLAAQRVTAGEDRRVRIAVHACDAEARDGTFSGDGIHHTAAVLRAGHGGQTLVSAAAAELADGNVPAGASLTNLGEHKLSDLAAPEQLFALTATDLPATFPPLRTLDVVPNNLARQLTPFLGRERELADIDALLDRSRIVTLVGAGGIGKTRISMQAAAEALDRFPDGAWLLEVAALTDPGVIYSVLTSTMSELVASVGSSEAAILGALRARRCLLIFDNCEHIAGVAAAIIERIVLACPHVSVLASSREILGIPGESVYRMPTLAFPESTAGINAHDAARYGAINLFVERAQAADRSFTLTDENAPQVAEMCRQLDGIPLAIALTASRMHTFDDAALGLQPTTRALMDWSYNLLSPRDRTVFRRVSVFAGGWRSEGAAAVCDDASLDAQTVRAVLTTLVETSLAETANGDEHRYRMVESIRAYARERLVESGEERAARQAHAEYYNAFCADIDARHMHETAEQIDAVAAPELDNIRAALTWTLIDRQDVPLGLTLLGAARSVYFIHSSTAELREWLDIARPLVDGSATPQQIAGLALCEAQLAELGSTREAGNAGLRAAHMYEALGEVEHAVLAYTSAVMPLALHGRMVDAREAVAEAERLLAAHDWPIVRAALLRNKSYTLDGAERAELRLDLLRESLAILQACNDDRRAYLSLAWLSDAEFHVGHLNDAIIHGREAIAITRRRLPRSQTLSILLHNLSAYLLDTGNIAEAYALARESTTLARDLGFASIVWFSLVVFADVASRSGRLHAAARLLGASEKCVQDAGRVQEPTEQHVFDQTSARLRKELGNEVFDAEFLAGSRLTDAALLAEALVPPEAVLLDVSETRSARSVRDS